jgi:tetratricopeptide (TPR) repeat protein
MRNAEGNLYENFYFPPSAEFYEIHLHPSHERATRVSVNPANQPVAWDNLPLDAEFDLVFTQDMISPLVEQNTSINDEYNKPIAVSFIWQGKRRVTMRPKNELTPAARYTIYVELEARDAEGDRLVEAAVQEFYTASITEVMAVDLLTMIFDIMPGAVKMDWKLPPNVVGSELRMQDGTVTDLQAKTTLTFTDEEAGTAPFKIVPYRIINNRKAYSQEAENALYTTAVELHRKYSDALAPIKDAIQQGQNFYDQGRYREAIVAYSNAARLLESRNLQTLATVYERIGHAHYRLGNYHETMAAYQEAIDAYQEAVNAYKKAIEIDPSNTDTKRSLDDAEAALKAITTANRRRAFLGRVLNYEVYGGSSFTAPWAIIGASNQIYLSPHTFFEAGCDFGFIPGSDYQSNVSYYSIYPYARFNAYVGTKIRPYAGVGGGWMMARYQDGDDDNRFSVFTFDLAAGLHLNFSRRQGIAASYSLRTLFEPFFQTLNHKVTLGYLIHF